MTGDSAYERYLVELTDRFWAYKEQAFGAALTLFDGPRVRPDRAPVFRPGAAELNIPVPPDTDDLTARRIRGAISAEQRHQHFGSMRSSQALAQTVFANLQASGELQALADLRDDNGQPVFCVGTVGEMRLEHTVEHLGEPRPTQIDVWFSGPMRVAVECKLTEAAVGSCSRPRLRPSDPAHPGSFCDGTYTRQRGRTTRCSLTEIGARYWTFIPELFHWPSDQDLSPCPLRHTYQLARNILAACATPEGTVDSERGLAVLIYDNRNPAHLPNGQVGAAWLEVKQSLHTPQCPPPLLLAAPNGAASPPGRGGLAGRRT